MRSRNLRPAVWRRPRSQCPLPYAGARRRLAESDRERLRFYRLPPPSDARVACVAARVARRIARLLQRRGLGPDAGPEETDALIRKGPLLAVLHTASVCGRTKTGPRAGMRGTTAGITARWPTAT